MIGTRDAIIQSHTEGFKRRQTDYKELFDLSNWKESDSYKLIKEYCRPTDKICEIGCLTGHHLILLEKEEGYKGFNMIGIDFVHDAIQWARDNSEDSSIYFCEDYWPIELVEKMDRIILFDIVEHVHELRVFFKDIVDNLKDDGKVLILVPKAKEYFDKDHINFYPDGDCLKNLLVFYFNIELIEERDNKIFAVVTKKNE